jgi:nucleotide-binding universal stress UspA family protein
MYKHILVPTDGSELATRGLACALELARTLSARVTVLNAIEPFTAVFSSPDGQWIGGAELAGQLEAAQEQTAKKVLAEAQAQAATAGVVCDTLFLNNAAPSDAIVQTAQERGCDLIVMASHGRRGVKRMMLGSQTAEVLAHSTIPVLVIR